MYHTAEQIPIEMHGLAYPSNWHPLLAIKGGHKPKMEFLLTNLQTDALRKTNDYGLQSSIKQFFVNSKIYAKANRSKIHGILHSKGELRRRR